MIWIAVLIGSLASTGWSVHLLVDSYKRERKPKPAADVPARVIPLGPTRDELVEALTDDDLVWFEVHGWDQAAGERSRRTMRNGSEMAALLAADAHPPTSDENPH